MRSPFRFASSPCHASSDNGGGYGNAGNALEQTLRMLGDRAGIPGGTLSPDTLNELARRAGVTSPSQIADLSRMMGVNPDSPQAQKLPQSVLFLVGDVECALPAETVQGVERVGDVTPVPNTVAWVLGVVQVWGSIISVVDLRGFLGLPTQPLTSRNRLVVVTHGEMTIGFVVDAIAEMRPLGSQTTPRDAAHGIPEWIYPFVSGTTEVDGRTVLRLDPDTLLYADKMHRYRTEM